MATTREQQPEQHIAELEHTVAQLIRATYSAVERLGGNAGFHGTGWDIWKGTGADPQALTDLHAHLQRHPAPEQD